MAIIDVLPWDPAFETGIAIIDRQHRGLVDLVNELASQTVHHAADEHMRRLTTVLVGYAADHFATEEAIWRRMIGNAALEAEHARLHREVSSTLNSFAQGSHDEARNGDLLVFLTRWLADHILQSDRRYALIAGEMTNGTTSEDAIRLADAAITRNATLLTDVLVGMYGTLATSALRLKREAAATRRIDEALRRSQALLSAVVDSTSDPIWTVDCAGFHLLFSNRAFDDLLERLTAGRNTADAAAIRQGAEASWVPFYERVLDEGSLRTEYHLPDHTAIYDLGIHLLLHAGTPYAISVFAKDITRQREDEEAIRQLAYFDPLTSLPNRRLFHDHLRKAVSLSRRTGERRAVLFIDLDNFKILNDTRGHPVGDLFLIDLARRISRILRREDTVGRMGGDEFAVLLGGLGDDDETGVRYCEVVADKLLDAIGESFHLGDQDYRTTCSIGICSFCDDGMSPEDILKNADAAMYQAKQAGKNTFCFYDPAFQLLLESRLAIESWLRGALPNQLVLHLQPQVTNDDHIIGAEALLRWIHPERGMISPAEFIPLAEDTGLIIPIGQWVIEQACAMLCRWASMPGFTDLLLAVNVSAKQFHEPGFVASIRACLQATGAPASCLKLELTESLLLAEAATVITKMEELRALGIRMSLDDFGTGYSSFSLMRTLPLDQLKIDQSFVRNVGVDRRDEAVVQTIIALGNTMDLEVIAEGVETGAQRGFLAGHGCCLYQGYLFSRPLPLAEFEAYVLRHPAAPRQ